MYEGEFLRLHLAANRKNISTALLLLAKNYGLSDCVSKVLHHHRIKQPSKAFLRQSRRQ